MKNSLANWCLNERAAPPAHQDYWYEPLGTATQAGIRIDPDTAMRVSTVYRCVSLIAGMVASLDLNMYKRTSTESREFAINHPLHDLLHIEPNEEQTSFEFKEFMTACLALRGNAYAEIIPGRRGHVHFLKPIMPETVTPRRLSNKTIVYDTVDPETGKQRRLRKDQVFHLKLYSKDGLEGMSPIAMHREGIALSMATEIHGARFFGAGSKAGGILHSEGKLTPEQRRRNKDSWNAAHRGVLNSHEIAVMEGGLKWQNVTVTNEDSQFLETRGFQVAEIAGRIYGVPLHLVGETTKSTSWGTGIEQQNLGFLQYTLEAYLKRWEGLILKTLIVAQHLYYAEFYRAALLRGDQKSRYESYEIGINAAKPWLSQNDVRRMEGMNPIPDGDDYSPNEHYGNRSDNKSGPPNGKDESNAARIDSRKEEKRINAS